MSNMFERFTPYVKLYGERNSGTNFVERLIRANFAVVSLVNDSHMGPFLSVAQQQVNRQERGAFRSAVHDMDCLRRATSDFGWKHGCPPVDAIMAAIHRDQTCFVCISKHPVSWLQSLHKRPYNPVERGPEDFSDFIRHDWLLTPRDNVTGRERVNVIDLWNLKYRAFLDLKTKPLKTLVVTYEALMHDPGAFLARVEEHLLKKVEDFTWDLPSTKGDAMDFEDYQQKYELKNVASLCSPEDFAFIMSRVDAAVMEELGYPLH
jgi:hypothetical protein